MNYRFILPLTAVIACSGKEQPVKCYPYDANGTPVHMIFDMRDGDRSPSYSKSKAFWYPEEASLLQDVQGR